MRKYGMGGADKVTGKASEKPAEPAEGEPAVKA